VFPSTEVELIPWLELLFPVRPPSWDPLMINSLLLPETAGKRFGNIFENHLNPLRVTIAHALFESGELALSTDDSFNIETVIKWLPVVKCIVRRMLKNEFPDDFLAVIRDPTPVPSSPPDK
jgi:hypothetical protein